MKEERILFCETMGEDGLLRKLSYCLTDDRIHLEEAEHTVYGLRCRMENGSSGQLMEETEIRDISSDIERVKELLQYLCTGKATPIHLKDLIYDWIC